MSIRKLRLCDQPGPYDRSKPFQSGVEPRRLPCDEPSIGTCVICDKDTCHEHRYGKDGGLSIDIVTLHGDKECAHDGAVPTSFTLANVRLLVCTSCGSNLTGVSTSRFNDAVAAWIKEALRAQLSAEALK